MGTQLTEEDLAALAQGSPDGAGAELECPECGRMFSSQASLNGHLASHRGGKAKSRAQASRERPPTPAGKAVGLDGAARTIVNKAVANTQTVGAFLAATVAPHTGLAIAGLKDPRTKQVIVRSRAEVMGEIILGQLASATSPDEMQRAARMIELLRRYNALFEYTAFGDVAGSLAVAGLVDARVIPADFKIQFGNIELPVAVATIGDVVAYYEDQGLYEAPPKPGPGDEPPPRPPGEAEEIAGGVEAT
jgi:C2H2-type zinc finger